MDPTRPLAKENLDQNGPCWDDDTKQIGIHGDFLKVTHEEKEVIHRPARNDYQHQRTAHK